jgi:hypothetical protein
LIYEGDPVTMAEPLARTRRCALVKLSDAIAKDDLLEELIRIVNEAQERDAEDERRLYDPMLRDRPSSFQRRRR